jgi:hypothetical protein
MKKAAHLLRRFEFHLLLFFLALLAFAKPTLLPSPNPAPTALLLAYFVPWGALIVVLFAIARSGPQGAEDDEFDPDPPAAPVPAAPPSRE